MPSASQFERIMLESQPTCHENQSMSCLNLRCHMVFVGENSSKRVQA